MSVGCLSHGGDIVAIVCRCLGLLCSRLSLRLGRHRPSLCVLPLLLARGHLLSPSLLLGSPLLGSESRRLLCLLLLLLLLPLQSQQPFVLGLLDLLLFFLLRVLALDVRNDLEALEPRLPSSRSVLAVAVRPVGRILCASDFRGQSLVKRQHVPLLVSSQSLIRGHLGNGPLSRLRLRRLVRMFRVRLPFQLADGLFCIARRL